MSSFVPLHCDLQPPVRDGTPTPTPEPLPDPDGVGRAQRSEPERSDGERSGARPPPAQRLHALSATITHVFPASSGPRPPFAFFACSAR